MATHARDPWYRINPQEKLTDLRLRKLCKENARALYYEGRHLMHVYGQPYGHLAFTPGVPMPIEKIADFLNMLPDVVQAALDEVCLSGLWQKTADGVPYDEDLIAIKEAVDRNRKNGSKGGNPNLKRPLNPPVNTQVNPATNPVVNRQLNPPVNPLSISLSPSSSPSPERERKKRERRPASERSDGREAAPSLDAFLTAFIGEGIDEAYLAAKWTYFEGHNEWWDKTGRLKNFAALVRGWWREDRAAWEAKRKPAPDSLQSAAAIEAQLKIEKDPERRKVLIARLKDLEP